jgi:hypothetical protein
MRVLPLLGLQNLGRLATAGEAVLWETYGSDSAFPKRGLLLEVERELLKLRKS